MTAHRLPFAIWLLGCVMLATAPSAFPQAQPATSATPTPAPAQPANSPAATAEPIGNVATLTGSATVTRNNASTPLKPQDDIYLNDVLQTGANSTLGITFNDATTFNLTANARIAVDSYLYQDGGRQNAAVFDIARGTVAFVAAAVARTGDMKIATPTATLGIRGTSGLVEVPEGGSTAADVAIKLYPDPDGRIGHIDVSDRSGARLGSLTRGASGFTIRPGAGGRFSASPLTISRQEALRDQGIVRQAHAAQSVGRQIVARQRGLRQANPARNATPRNNPARQPGLQRQNRPPQQRQGLQRQGTQRQNAQPGAAGVARPGSQNRPALQQRRPPAPKGRPAPKQRR